MTTYRLVITGAQDGHNFEDVIGNFTKLFKLPSDKARSLLSQSHVVIKHGVDLQTAAKYQAALEQAGCNSLVEPEVAAIPSPQADAQVASQTSPVQMKNVREGVTKAKFNKENSKVLFGEIFLISVGVGFYYKSWWAFGGTLLGLIIASFIKPIAILLMILLALGWGLVGYFIGAFFNSLPASVVLGIVGLLAGGGLHMSAMQYVRDIQ